MPSSSLQRKGALLLIDGLDVSKPADYLSETASPSNQNLFVDRGILRKRFGTTLVGATAGEEIMAGKEFEREGVKYNLRFGLTTVEKYNTTTEVWDDITGTALTGSTDDTFSTAVPTLAGKRILVFTNGIDNVRKYVGSGNTADLGGTPPRAKYVEEYKGYTLLANFTQLGVAQRVGWCDANDPENWTTGLSGEVDLIEDGKPITGLKKYGGFIAVHKCCAIYLGRLVSNNFVFQFDRIPTETGAFANSVIQNLPTGEQAFVGLDGIRVFDGRSAPEADPRINDEIRKSLNVEYAHKAWSVLVDDQDEVWFALPIGSDTTANTVYKFNYKTRVVYKDTRSNITSAWKYTNSSFQSWNDLVGSWNQQTWRWNDSVQQLATPLTMLSDNTGLSYKVDSAVNDDNNVAVNAFWESKDYLPVIGEMSRFLELELWAKGSSVRVEYSTDSGNTWQEVSQSPITLTSFYPSDDSPLIVYLDVVSSKIRFRFSNSNSMESLFLKQFVLAYSRRERRY